MTNSNTVNFARSYYRCLRNICLRLSTSSICDACWRIDKNRNSWHEATRYGSNNVIASRSVIRHSKHYILLQILQVIDISYHYRIDHYYLQLTIPFPSFPLPLISNQPTHKHSQVSNPSSPKLRNETFESIKLNEAFSRLNLKANDC